MKKIILLLLVLIPPAVFAQFNDSITHFIHYGSAGTFNKTNDANSFVLNNNFKFSIEKKTISFHTIDTWIYGEQSGVLINNDFSAVFDCDVLKNQQQVYYWAIATFDKSFSLKINHRAQAGAGLGLHLVRKDHVSVIVSDGLIYEVADLTDAELGQRKYDVWRNSLRVKYKWLIHNIVNLDGFGFLQPSLSSGDDTIIKSTTTLSLKLNKWFSLTSSLTYNKVTVTNRENLLMTYGLVMEKYF